MMKISLTCRPSRPVSSSVVSFAIGAELIVFTEEQRFLQVSRFTALSRVGTPGLETRTMSVSKLHIPALGAELTVLTQEHAD